MTRAMRWSRLNDESMSSLLNDFTILVEILADADCQAVFAIDTGALPANLSVDTSSLSSDALGKALGLMTSAPGGSPHALLNSAVLEEWKRQSQLLLNEEVTVDGAIEAMEVARKSN